MSSLSGTSLMYVCGFCRRTGTTTFMILSGSRRLCMHVRYKVNTLLVGKPDLFRTGRHPWIDSSRSRCQRRAMDAFRLEMYVCMCVCIVLYVFMSAYMIIICVMYGRVSCMIQYRCCIVAILSPAVPYLSGGITEWKHYLMQRG